jgi:hypothetical protein
MARQVSRLNSRWCDHAAAAPRDSKLCRYHPVQAECFCGGCLEPKIGSLTFSCVDTTFPSEWRITRPICWYHPTDCPWMPAFPRVVSADRRWQDRYLEIGSQRFEVFTVCRVARKTTHLFFEIRYPLQLRPSASPILHAPRKSSTVALTCRASMAIYCRNFNKFQYIPEAPSSHHPRLAGTNGHDLSKL